MNKFSYLFKRIFFYLGLISILLTIASCSSTRLGYGFLDTYILWKIDGYVSLTQEQKTFTRIGINDFHAWHRKEQIPLYAAYMEQLKPKLNNTNLSGAIIHKETDELQQLLDESINYLMPTLVGLAFSLSDDQIIELDKNLAKKRKKYTKQYVTVKKNKLYKKRINDLCKYMDPFFGRYTPQQKEWLEVWAKQLIDYEESMVNQQENWSANLLSALKNRTTKPMLHAQLKEIVLYRTDNWEPELNTILDKNQTTTYDLVATLVKSQTTKQRDKMNKKLDKYVSDFQHLSK